MQILAFVSGFLLGAFLGAGASLSIFAAQGILQEKHLKEELVKKEKKPYGLFVSFIAIAIFCVFITAKLALFSKDLLLTISLFIGFVIAMMATFSVFVYKISKSLKIKPPKLKP